MAEPSDVWYVRFPDGRVLRAGSTSAVRHHLESGEIPLESRVRRSPEQAWAHLDRIAEFADLVPARPRRHTPPPATRLPVPPPQNNDLQLHTVGVRSLIEELLKALDSTLVKGKLTAAALLGLTAAVLLMLAGRYRFGADLWAPLPWVVAGFVVLTLHGLCAVLLTQGTFVELSRLRPATREEARARLWGNALRLMLAELLTGGILVLLIVGLRWVEGSLEGQANLDILLGIAASVRLVLQVVLWPVLGLGLLLGPILVIEECSVTRALGQWWSMLWRHLGRLFVYEALVAALALVLCLPLLFPVLLAGGASSAAELGNPIVSATFAGLGGLALTPLLAYVSVANVYIYLNLRYEATPGPR